MALAVQQPCHAALARINPLSSMDTDAVSAYNTKIANLGTYVRLSHYAWPKQSRGPLALLLHLVSRNRAQHQHPP
jgi:hypothetical protein